MSFSNKSLAEHIKEHHHRFHFFFVLILATSISLGIYIGSLARAQTALLQPNHAINLSYFYIDSSYGDFKSEVGSFVNTYMLFQDDWLIDQFGLVRNDPANFNRAFSEAVASGKNIVFTPGCLTASINNGFSSCASDVSRGLDIAKNYWGSISMIYFDEPNLDKAGMESFINSFNAMVSNKGLPIKPMGVNFYYDQIMNGTGYQATNIDEVGFEAYIGGPHDYLANGYTRTNSFNVQDDPNVVSILNTSIGLQMARIGNRPMSMVIQGYDRNGSWTNISSLKSIQTPAYLKAYNDSRIKELFIFAYGRDGTKGGTRYLNQCIRTEHQRMWGAISGTTQPASIACSGVSPTPPPPTPTPTPVPTTSLSFPCRAAIQGYTGNYANDSENGWNLNMQSPTIGPTETFTFIDLGERKFALRGVSGHYANENTYNFNIQSTTIGPDETLTFISLGGNKFSIQGNSGDYGSDDGGGNFYMNSASIGQKETLTLVPISGTCISSSLPPPSPPLPPPPSSTPTPRPPLPPTCSSAGPDGDTVALARGTRRAYTYGVSSGVTVVDFITWNDAGTFNKTYSGVNDGRGTWHADIILTDLPALGSYHVHPYMTTPGLPQVKCDSADFILSTSSLPPPSPSASLRPTPTVSASPPAPQSIFDSFSLQSVPKILSGLACYFVRFALILVGIAVILSGIIFIFSRGNPTAFTNAKKNLLYVIIGGLVIYGVYTIILSVSLFVAGSTVLPWIPLTCS